MLNDVPFTTTYTDFLEPLSSSSGDLRGRPSRVTPRGLWPGRYAKVTGIVLHWRDVLAIVAAIVGLVLRNAALSIAAPSGWTKAYDGNLENTSQWTGDGGCYTGANGLDVTAGRSL